MRRLLFLIAFVLLSFPGLLVSQSAPGVRDQLETVSNATSLVSYGTKPWHLHMAVKIYDAFGAHPVNATLEEWWVAPDKYRRVFTAPGLSATWPTPQGETRPPYGRSLFLLDQLLSAMVEPVTDVEEKHIFSSTPMTVGGAKLMCLVDSPRADIDQEDFDSTAYYCVDPGTNVLRVVRSDSHKEVVRNHTGKFQGRDVATSVSISWGGNPIIEGDVDGLGTLSPAKVAELQTTDADEGYGMVSSKMTGGKLIQQTKPQFPNVGTRDQPHGDVVVGFKVSETGTPENLFVISSPTPLLSTAVEQAVHFWRFAPSELDGKSQAVTRTWVWEFR